MLKSLSTGAEDAGMQRNLFSSKTILRIIRNVVMPENNWSRLLTLLRWHFETIVFQYFKALIYYSTSKKSKFFITLPSKEVERIELMFDKFHRLRYQ